MDCKSIHKKLIFFIDGDLPDDEMKVVSKHLIHCQECNVFAESLRKTMEVVEVEKQYEPSTYFYTKLKAKLEKQLEPAPVETGGLVWERILQPALFVILLIAGMYGGFLSGRMAGETSFNTNHQVTEVIPFLNELEIEPIETFLIE